MLIDTTTFEQCDSLMVDNPDIQSSVSSQSASSEGVYPPANRTLMIADRSRYGMHSVRDTSDALRIPIIPWSVRCTRRVSALDASLGL